MNIDRVREAIEYLQKCKHLIGDDLIGEHCHVYDSMTLMLAETLCAEDAVWETATPARLPVTEDDLRHPLVGPEERGLLAERLYRVLHIVDPEAAALYDETYATDSAEFPELQDYIEDEAVCLIYDVESKMVVCDVSQFFHTMGINTFVWRG